MPAKNPGLYEGQRNTEQILGIAGPKDQPGGLYEPYLENFLDFLARARAHNIYVIPVLSFVPQNDYFAQRVELPSPNSTIEGINKYYMFSPAIEAKVEYIRKFVGRVAAEDGGNLRTTILSYELQNEMEFDASAPPFQGVQQADTADGLTYNMNIPDQRQQCANANAVHWTNKMVEAIQLEDPDALTSVSMFTMEAVNRPRPDGVAFRKENNRYPALPAPFAAFSNLSYVSMHLYPKSSSYTPQSDLASSDFPDYLWRTPTIMGEFGAYRHVYPIAQSAGVLMKKHRDDVFALGFSGQPFQREQTYYCFFLRALWASKSRSVETWRCLLSTIRGSRFFFGLLFVLRKRLRLT